MTGVLPGLTGRLGLILAAVAQAPRVPPAATPSPPAAVLDASRFGARGDGKADDTAALQAALDTGRSVRLARGRYAVSATLRLKADGQQLLGAGLDATTIVARGDFSACVRADGLGGVAVRDLTVDADRAGRRAALTTRTLGIFLVNCRDARVESCRVTGTVGGPVAPGGRPMPGVGIAIGYGRHCVVAGCRVDDCGTKAENTTSDAIYTSGAFNIVRDCAARNCTDTAFVVEDSDHSGVVDCRAEGCSCGLAITSARDRPSRGNYADRVHITGWDSAVTGGVSVGCPRPEARGDLLDTSLTDVTLESPGRGPAVAVRRTGPARVIGLTVRGAKIRGAGTQGLLVDAEQAVIEGCEVADTGWAAIQVQPGCRDALVRRCSVANPTRFGITVLGRAKDVIIVGNRVEGAGGRMAWGVFVSDAAEGVVTQGNTVTDAGLGGVGRGPIGAAPGATPPSGSGSGMPTRRLRATARFRHRRFSPQRPSTMKLAITSS